MAELPAIAFTIGLDAAELDDRNRQLFSKQLLPELRQLDEVDRADRTEDLLPDAERKGFATLAGWLTAEVSAKNVKGFVSWLGQRLADKPVKVKVKVGDREVELEAKSQAELLQLEAMAMNLIAKLQPPSPPTP